MAGMKRLFFGLSLNDAARDAIHDAASRVACEKGRFHEKDNYHLTLVFLGMTPEEAVPQLLRVAKLAMKEPFDVTLSGRMGTFKNGSILWAGVDGCEKLFALQKRLSVILKENGFPGGDEPYTPHITVGRGMKLTSPAPEVVRAAFPVSRVTLYESLREDDRLVYRPLN